MSHSTSIPVAYPLHATITQENIQTVGSKGSYVTSKHGSTKIVMLPGTEEIPVPSHYEMPLRVLSYRFELQKYTIPQIASLRPTCKILLNNLLYLDRVRDRFVNDVRVVPTSDTLLNWRCAAFDYHLWLDYIYGQYDDQARRLLQSEHGITFEHVALKKPGTDILKTLDWVTYKTRHCQEVDLCGFDYPLESVIRIQGPPAANIWAKSLFAQVSIVGHYPSSRGKGQDKCADILTVAKRGKRKCRELVEHEDIVGEQNPGQSWKRDTSRLFVIAMENLRNLLCEDAAAIDSDVLDVDQRDEILGLRLFKDALENYNENPRLLEQFFRLTGTASRLMKDIHQSQPMPVSDDNAEFAGNPKQPSSSKTSQVPSKTPVPHFRPKDSTHTTHTASEYPALMQFNNEDLFKAWKKYRKP